MPAGPIGLDLQIKHMTDNTTQEQLIELETRLAYQEDTMQQLSDQIYQQQQQIDRLEKLVIQLLDQTREIMASSSGEVSDERPPHY